MHRGASRVGVHHQQGARVGIEVRVQVARQVDHQFGDRAGGDVPDQQLVAAATLMTDQQSLIAPHG